MLPLISLILSGISCYGQEIKHCIPLDESRFIHEQAAKYRYAEQAIDSLEGRVAKLEDERQTFQVNINNVILNEQAKVNDATLLADDYKKLYEVSEEEKQHLQKSAKKAKRKLTAAIIIGVGLVVLAVTN
jgi:uncharacterized protein YhaN